VTPANTAVAAGYVREALMHEEQRADMKVRKGPEKIQGDFSCQDQQNRDVMGWI